ncbi:MAG: diaminopimelate epimerase [bacterium]
MSASFLKMTAAGNDFLVFDDRDGSCESTGAQRWARLCRRRTGVGADGVLLIRPSDHRDAMFAMRYLNADGSAAAMCGNGARCIAWAAAVEKGLGRELSVDTPRPRGWELPEGIGARQVWSVSFEAPDGLHRAVGWERTVMVTLGDPTPLEEVSLAGEEGGADREGSLLAVGVPHLVLPVGDPGEVDVAREGARMRRHESLGPEGANVDFLALEPDASGAHAIRTYERGVEGETLACGTGAASCAVLLARKGSSSPLLFRPRSGELLRVHFDREPGEEGEPDRIRDLWLEGPVTLVFRGTLADV